MKLTNKIVINERIDKVWKVFAEDFHLAYQWMSSVPHSYKIEKGDLAVNSPMVGRICELSDEGDKGLQADERILSYDKENYTLTVRVTPFNGNLPLNGNTLVVKMRTLSPLETEVLLLSSIDLKLMGKILKPFLKKALHKSLDIINEELKYYVEHHQPHPRKVKKMMQKAS